MDSNYPLLTTDEIYTWLWVGMLTAQEKMQDEATQNILALDNPRLNNVSAGLVERAINVMTEFLTQKDAGIHTEAYDVATDILSAKEDKTYFEDMKRLLSLVYTAPVCELIEGNISTASSMVRMHIISNPLVAHSGSPLTTIQKAVKLAEGHGH